MSSPMPGGGLPELLPHFAHDLRASLRTMLLQAQRMQRAMQQNALTPATASPKLDAIVAAAKRQDALITGFLELLRATEPESNLATPMPLRLALQAACQKVESLRSRVHGSISVEVTEHSGQVHPVLVRILEKLLENSLIFNRSGVAPELVLCARVEDGAAIVSLQDNGLGIEPSYRNKVFAPFFCINPPQANSGPGLGLTVAQLLATRHGALLTVDGRPDGEPGTMVQLTGLLLHSGWSDR